MAQQSARLELTTPLRGLDGLIDGAMPFGVPRGAGVSSSSALTVAAAVALAAVNGWEPGGADLARFCSTAEWYVGTRGGVMDHFASILSRQGHALFLDCRPASDGAYVTRHVPMPAGYRLMVVDSGVHHENARGEFNLRVAACRAGVAVLARRLSRNHAPQRRAGGGLVTTRTLAPGTHRDARPVRPGLRSGRSSGSRAGHAARCARPVPACLDGKPTGAGCCRCARGRRRSTSRRVAFGGACQRA